MEVGGGEKERKPPSFSQEGEKYTHTHVCMYVCMQLFFFSFCTQHLSPPCFRRLPDHHPPRKNRNEKKTTILLLRRDL